VKEIVVQVRVRVETPVLGLTLRSEVVLERTDRVQAAVEQGRLTVLEELYTEEELAAEAAAEAATEQGDEPEGAEQMVAELTATKARRRAPRQG
jgi:hypothetical protein